VRTHVFGKVVVKKNPTFPRFCSGQQSQLGAAAHFFRVHVEKGGSLLQIEGIHYRPM
jgi:hypothetical protein